MGKWREHTEYERCQKMAEKYLKWKGSRLLIQLMQDAVLAFLLPSWNKWVAFDRVETSMLSAV